MASRAMTFRVTAVRVNKVSAPQGVSLKKAIGDWFRKGQLGTTNYTEMGRYTGGRV